MSIGVALVIGGEPALSRDQRQALVDSGLTVVDTADIAEAARRVREGADQYDLVILARADADSRIDESLARLRDAAPGLPIILLVPVSELAQAYSAAAGLAYDCLPVDVAGSWLGHKARQAVSGVQWPPDRVAGPQTVKTDSGETNSKKRGAGLVGVSPAIERVREAVAEAAESGANVLVLGEIGSGKDLVSRLVHDARRPERNGGYMKISCPALPDHVLDSELFGHESGAFPGAMRSKPGRLELAVRGTVYLDEIADISPAVQGKLVEFIDQGTFVRAGGNETIRADARVVASTRVAPRALLDSERLRRDLYFRLNEYLIQVPPLRERVEDIPLLVDHFLEKYAALAQGEPRTVSPGGLSGLVQYEWPGNVRELESAVKRFVLSGDERDLTSAFVGAERGTTASSPGDLYQENEKRVILAALAESRWNRRKAARLLGISYNTLRRRIERYHLDATHAG